jgi:hypothetical protein
MTETTADNRPQPLEPESHPESVDTEPVDKLDRIAAELDTLAELDPAESVPVLAEITAVLNRELDADADRS